MPRRLFFTLLLLGLAILSPLTAAPDKTPSRQEVLALMDTLQLGLSRAEMMETVKGSVRGALQGLDPSLTLWGSMYVDTVVTAAFSLHEVELKTLQESRADFLAARFNRQEVRQLAEIFAKEPVRRLLSALQESDSTVQLAGDAFMQGVQAEVERLMSARLSAMSGAGESAEPDADPQE